MNELALFAGAGGGLLASKLMGWRTIGYVEWEPYCQEIIKARIRDGYLDAAPIFGDVRKFVSEGYAESYKGMVDVLTAGFPCQPFSVAGKQKAANDERNMWSATADAIRIVRPRYAFLENTPGLLATGYCEQIFGDLAAMGYDAKWGVFSACSEGAPHTRERVFIVANRNGERFQERQIDSRMEGAEDAYKIRQTTSICTWWSTEPEFHRLDDGTPNRVGRIKAAGNSQVPIVACSAWEILNQ